MLRVGRRAGQLRRVAAGEEGFGLPPHVVERGSQDVFLDRRPFRRRDRVPTRERPVQVEQLLSSHGEHGAALQHLNFHAHLEHVGGRGHRHVRLPGLGQHPPDGVRTAGLDAGLVDRPRHYIGRAEGECRSH